ncbi:hypothetical protein C7N43_02695 [Sphingobacteriales bacterium UPWRP_1]|nr:hypothetical protein B6N25_06190 [Sphingobacteriales bacterium TSM_CSS]PSJ78662.1 hypothetical protein C7N43_02695 [Sphingobacteriales bacterium UPWRP_1]
MLCPAMLHLSKTVPKYWLFALLCLLCTAGWVAAQQPMYRHYSIDNGLPTMQTYNIVQDSLGYIWVSTSTGVCLFNGQTFFCYSTPADVPTMYVRNLNEQLKTKLWRPVNRTDAAIEYQNALYNDSDTARQHLLPNQNSFFLQPVSCVLQENRHTLWIGTWGGGAYLCTNYQTPQLKVQPLLLRKTITAILKDRECNYWFCTLDDGVFLLSHPNVLTFTTDNGLPSNNIYSVTGNRNGNIWAGTGRGSVARLSAKGNQWDSFTPGNSANAFNRINDIAFDQNNNAWFATDGGLYFMNRQTDWFVVNLTPTTSLAYAQNNLLWVGKYQYPSQINTKTGSETTILPIRQQVNALAVDANGRLWIGTSGGLYRNENGKNYYLGNKAPLLSKPINDLCTDTMNRLWLATADTGVLVKRNNALLHLTIANGLSCNNCNAIFADDQNRIWVATNNGLNLITLKNMEANTAKVTTITTADGLAADFVNDVWVHADSVWVATVNGLTLFPVPNIKPDTATPLPVYLHAIKVWNQPVPLKSNYLLKYNQNNISIEFAGISYRLGGKLQYLYQMQGLQNEWLQTGLTMVQYPSLPPGDYVFRVAAYDKWGRISRQTASVRLVIMPPLWQTWYFKLAALLLLASGVIGAAYLAVSYFKDRSELQRRTVESEQMALRTQMNPHFIFNSLNAIQYFITQNDKLSANRYLSVFATLIRKVLNNSQRSYISLEEELEYLQLYLQIEALRFKDMFDYKITVAPNIVQSETGIPPMLIQPYVENAIQHGLLRKTEGSRNLHICFEQPMPDVLLCTVTDNGIGRNKARALESNRTGTGIGTINPRERLALLNRLLKKPIEVQITDLYTTDKEPSGTEVKIAIPVFTL